MKIDWNKVWADYSEWFLKTHGYLPLFKKRGNGVKKIQSLVEAQLKSKRKK